MGGALLFLFQNVADGVLGSHVWLHHEAFPKRKVPTALLAAGQYARVVGDGPQHLPPTHHGLRRNQHDNNIRATRLHACWAVANRQRTA